MRRATLGLFLLVLSACLLVGGGCGRAGVPGAPPGTRLAFWHIQTSAATRKVVEDAVGRFEVAHDGVSVATVAIKNDDYKLKLSQAMAAGDVPDVFHTWGGGRLREYVEEKQVADLTEAAAADNLTARILPAALRFATVDGRLYAVPMDVSAVVMWYNRPLFEKHGVTPPATWDELKAACAKLRAAGVTPIALGNKSQWPGAFYFVYLAARLGGTKPFDDAASRAPNGTFEHPSFIEAGRRLQELAQAGAFNDGADIMSYDDALGLFVREKAAMMLMGTWFLADLKGPAPEMVDRVGCFPFPEVPGGAPGTESAKIVVGGINSAYAVSARCPNVREAVALIASLTGDLTARRWAETGRIPALRADLADGMLLPATREAARLLYEAPAVQLYYDQALPRDLAERHKSTTQALLAGTTTPEEAAKTMETLAARLAAGGPRDAR